MQCSTFIHVALLFIAEKRLLAIDQKIKKKSLVCQLKKDAKRKMN